MTSLITEPQLLATAAEDVSEIRSAIGAAKSAAATPTTSVTAAAADEVSAAAAKLFGGFGQEYQALLSQASAFHEEFASLLASAGLNYSAAESANAGTFAPVAAVTGLFGSPAPSDVTVVMGGSGTPIPGQPYINGVFNWVENAIPGSVLANAQGLFTPEGLYPLTGVHTLPLNESVSEGVQILDSTLFSPSTGLITAGGKTVTVLGYSQSAVISSLEMEHLATIGNPNTADLNFVLLGDPMNPNGGLLERFAGLTLPSLGLDFYGATPPTTPYATNIYTLQYDGFADFPRYPINILADVNALAGINSVHGTYPVIDPNNLPAGDTIVELPGSASLPGGTGATNYYMITEPNLPILNGLRNDVPFIGNALADLVQPDMTTLVNLGYGDPAHGYSTSPANVPTPFGLFPHVSQALIAQDLITGAQQGGHAFVTDISAEASGLSLASLSSSVNHLTTTGQAVGTNLQAGLTAFAANPVDTIIGAIQTANTEVSTFVSSTASTLYSVLLPTADILNAVVVSLPSYDVNLFLNGIQEAIGGDLLGGLQYALVAPIAADVGLVTLAGGFELSVIESAVTSIA